jgi:uncharacterized membrane protein
MKNQNKRVPEHKNEPVKKNSRSIIIGLSAFVILAAAFFIVKGITGSKVETSQTAQQGAEIQIAKSEITQTAKFIPYQAGDTNMELIAVKAPDGTIRTAFNICQVCYDSGRGYYMQEGDELVCQNCGNRFNISQIELQKNGCNPVPILDANKTDNGATITISKDFLNQNKNLFGNWKKS